MDESTVALKSRLDEAERRALRHQLVTMVYQEAVSINLPVADVLEMAQEYYDWITLKEAT